jgi:hypothetical protein
MDGTMEMMSVEKLSEYLSENSREDRMDCYSASRKEER